MKSVFTQIIQGDLPGVVLYEDEYCVALMDAFPMLPGHVLVIPRQETVYLRDLSCDLREHLFTMVSHVAEAQHRAGLSCGDTNIVLNDGKAAGQSVPHVHVHVVPRKRGDSFPFPALAFNMMNKLLKRQASSDELERIAETLRQHMNTEMR